MTLEEYMRELVLMSRQYGQEEELYPLINMLLRENDNVRHLSVRDVHNGQRDNKKENYNKNFLYGYASFPDLAILDERYGFSENVIENDTENEKKLFNMMYGCVEAKIAKKGIYLDPIVTEENWARKSAQYYDKKGKVTPLGQLIGELLWYGKVLYTRGWIWYFIELKNPLREKIREDDRTLIGDDKIPNKLIMQENMSVLCINIGDFRSVCDQKFDEMKKEKYISTSAMRKYLNDENRQEWERLKYNLACINWFGNNTEEQFIKMPNN